jgi:hypothetical protein
MHFGALASDEDTVFDAINDHVVDDMFQHTVVGVSIERVDILKLDGVSATKSYIIPDVTNWRGTASGEVTIAVAAIVKLQTGLQGPANRGRIFLPWVAESRQNHGVLSGTVASDLTTAWNAFQTAITAEGVLLVVASYKNEEIHSVINLVGEAACGTQRRRQQAIRATL